MKGTFWITSDYLKELGACDKGLLAFKEAYPQGGEYQEILDRCCAEGHTDWALWLLSEVGATDDVRTYDEFVSDEKLEIVFAGRIEFKIGATIRRLIAGTGIEAGKYIKAGAGIKAGTGIKAGWGIKAGAGIKAGTGIKAGWGIKAGTGIKAGEGIEAGDGIEAGWDIKAGLGIEAGKGIEAGANIKAGAGIKAGANIKAGKYIKAGAGIKAGTGIKAGWGIKAGEDIVAGEGYGIFAGVRIKISLWEQCAKVTAKSKPENIISGYWEQLPN